MEQFTEWNHDLVEKFMNRNKAMIEALAAYYKAKGHTVTIEHDEGDKEDGDLSQSGGSPYTGVAVHFDAGNYYTFPGGPDSKFKRSADEAAKVLGGKVCWEQSEGSGRWFIDIPGDGDEPDGLGRYVTVWTADEDDAACLNVPKGSLMVYGWLVW